ncbi:MAG: hypothetical protein OEV00_15030, partial [Acidobacteriota bacterium]|nr:hypothetical protein [Acidobacteriota bacterium]
MSADRYLTSPLRALRATFPLDLRGLATLGGIILIGKLAWLVWRGPAYEMDTATYLGQSLTFHHPPIYGWLLRWLEGIWPQAYFVAAVQAVVMAAGLALACAHFGRSPRETRILAILFAIDPITSFFSANLMSEALFIPGTLLWLCLVHQYLREERTDNRRTLVLLIGVWLAAIYSVRLAAIIFPGFFALASLWAPGPKRILRAVLHTIVIFLVLQVMILPMKYAYWKEYKVFGMGNFAGVNLWNSVSVLYPDSSIRDN